MAPDITARYQRASDLLEDVLAERQAAQARRASAAGTPAPAPRPPREDARAIQSRLRAREAPAARFCWQCRKPLHARTDKCPFCGELQ
jgi:hypothetical protein